MAGYSLDTILSPLVILDRISRIAMPNNALSKLFRWNLGQGHTPGAMFGDALVDAAGGSQAGNTDDYEGRSGQYDIFDHTRSVATGRAPDQAHHIISPQRVGKVNFTIPRVAEGIPLTYERMHNRRSIGGPAGELDRQGANYIDAQIKYMAQRVSNLVEFQTAAMLHGKYYFQQYGDAIYQTLTQPGSGPYETIDFQVPATHKSQLDMGTGSDIVTATWSNTATDIPGQIYAINRAMIQASGVGLKHVIVPSEVWQHVLNNSKVQAQAGTSNKQTLEFAQQSDAEFMGVIVSLPWVTFHVIDYGLDIWAPGSSAEAYTRLIPATSAIFIPEIDATWATYIRGGETVVEGPNGSRSFQYGYYPYSYETHEPAGRRLSHVHNGFPALKVPKAIAHGTVVF